MNEAAQLITAIATLIAAVGAVVVGLRNSTHIKKVEAATNGMKAELVNEVRTAAMAAGLKQGREERQ